MLACPLQHVYQHKDLFVLQCSDMAHCGTALFLTLHAGDMKEFVQSSVTVC